ncbi:MAG: ComEC/Rec2 family competence protein [Hyphomicrobiaceae bacterium]
MTTTTGMGQARFGLARRLLQRGFGALEAEQDRWFLWVPVLFGLGIAGYFSLAAEPALWPLLPLSLVAASLYLLTRNHGLLILLGGLVLPLIAGFTIIKVRTETTRAPILQRAIGPALVEGWIELIEARPQRGERITVRVVRITNLAAEATPVRVRVRTLAADPSLRPGDGIRINAFLNPPGGPALPGDYDFGRAAWFQRLGAVGYTREPLVKADLGPVPLSIRWRAPIERLRQIIGARIAAALPGETGAIATALITGERGGISDATNDAFRDSGLLHILSISGLHMVIMGGAVFFAVRGLLTLVPELALRYPIKKWAATAAALAALGYLLISGASFPTVRSYIMISIMYLALLLDRPAVALRNIAVAALIILVIWPESLIDVSFQMSFAAVIGLVAAYEMLREREQARAERQGDGGVLRQMLRLLGGILGSTLIASIAVAPFAAYHFHKSQQYAMLANLMAIPVCNLLVMPAALAALVAMPLGLETWPLSIMGAGIQAMVWCAYAVAGLPGAVTRIPAIPALAFGLIVAGGLWLALWRQRPRWLGLIPMLAGLALAPMRTAPDLIAGRDGAVIAWRGEDRRLVAIGDRQAQFDLTRWLEHDGDDRRAQDILAVRPRGLACDWSGCTALIKGRRVAMAWHPAALADDCRSADILITGLALPETMRCERGAARPTIDVTALARNGAHVLHIDRGGQITTSTVADWRGVRPWSAPSDGTGRPTRRRTPSGGPPIASEPVAPPSDRPPAPPVEPQLRDDEP